MSANSAEYRIKSSGSSTEPCGTEHMTWITREDTPLTTTSTTTLYVLSVKDDVNHARPLPSVPINTVADVTK